jgi:hypothetical protein
MRKILTATAIAASLVASGTAFAKDALRDYSDKTYTCDKDDIEEHMTSLVENSAAGQVGVRLLYIKGNPVETSRKPNELRCRITIVTNRFTGNGIFRFVNQDDHA